ncbi:MAG: hypothetical protein ACTSX0_14935 [Promethearchaeota archaeon]
MSLFEPNRNWKKWADEFDVALDKVVKANPDCWMTLDFIIDEQTWNKAEALGKDPYFEMTLPQYFTGKMWDRIRIRKIRQVPREKEGEPIMRFEIIQKYDPTQPLK